jgi:mRNA interferase RelE/StbE
MRFEIEYNAEARRDLRKMSPKVVRRVIGKIERLADGLIGDVKRLRQFSPSYRLRVGDWRVLFEIEDGRIVIHHVSHRSSAY